MPGSFSWSAMLATRNPDQRMHERAGIIRTVRPCPSRQTFKQAGRYSIKVMNTKGKKKDHRYYFLTQCLKISRLPVKYLRSSFHSRRQGCTAVSELPGKMFKKPGKVRFVFRSRGPVDGKGVVEKSQLTFRIIPGMLFYERNSF